MDALLYFALWAGLVFLIMRLGCGAHIMGRGRGKQGDPAPNIPAGGPSEVPRWVPPETDIDPVCGKAVDTATAKSSVHHGWVYYFCSADCRARFEVDPETYLCKGGPQRPARLEHSHG